jgi:WD40 repeat protein
MNKSVTSAVRSKRSKLLALGTSICIVGGLGAFVFRPAQNMLGLNYLGCIGAAGGSPNATDGIAPLYFVAGTNLLGPVMSSTEIYRLSMASLESRSPNRLLKAGILTKVASGAARANVLWTPSVNLAKNLMVYIRGSGTEVGESGGDGQVVISRPDGSQRRVLIRYDTQFGPVISPDGREIAYISDGQIVLKNLARGQLRTLPSPGTMDSVAWSPNGECVVATEKYPSRLAIINVRTGAWYWVPAATSNAYYPAWSPDGQRIVYGTDSGSLMVVDLADERTKVLVTCRQATCSGNWQPAWSPDGELLAFTRSNGSPSQVFVVAGTGGRPRQITFGPAQHACPTW